MIALLVAFANNRSARQTGVGTIQKIFRLQFVLQCESRVALSHQQAGLIYALLSEANGLVLKIDPVLPADVIPEPIEQCRPDIAPHSRWGFGLTLFVATTKEALDRCEQLRTGLNRLGRKVVRPGLMLGGNFRLVEIRDLVTKRFLRKNTAPTAISDVHIMTEIERALTLDRFTLRFTTPLRMAHSKHGLSKHRNLKTGKDPKPQLMDHQRFDAQIFLKRIAKRVSDFGMPTPLFSEHEGKSTVEESHLIWYDVRYSAGEREKHLPGALGDIVLSGLSAHQIALLVQAQYLHVGENTRFGHGRFRIAQLGPDPFAAQRLVSLRQLAFHSKYLDAAAQKHELSPGRAGQLAQDVQAGSYKPQEPTRLTIKSGSRQRILTIPHPEDRVLQRAVHTFLAPTLDRVLEKSSLAYRRGHHREMAAKEIKLAANQGYAWALKADFADFYDSIDHEELRYRLRAYLADPALEGLIMMWVRSGSPTPDCGLPTGAVISPLLANLFLDEFDESIAAGGGRLLRYADDFVILFKDREQADQIQHLAHQTANDLKLELNANKTQLIDLRDSFRFLGYEFSCGENWDHTPLGKVQPLHEIGWQNVTDLPAENVGHHFLPGETDEVLTSSRSLALLGPEGDWIDLRGGVLRRRKHQTDQPENLIAINKVDHLFVVGFPTLHRNLLQHLARTDTPLLLASHNGLDEIWITSRATEDANVIRQQIVCHDDIIWRLQIARGLIESKIANYASLATARPLSNAPTLPDHLQQLAIASAQADSVEQLLGLEGAAANAWYSHFSQQPLGQFGFPGRRSPNANDAVNILLNIGFTALHNWTAHFLRIHGFASALGIMHEPRARFAALAADMMEPFRHLVDATVLDCVQVFKARDFKKTKDGPFPVTIAFPALKQFRAALWKRWLTFHLPPHRQAAVPYLKSLEQQVITLRRHLLDRRSPFVPFRQVESIPRSEAEEAST